MKSDDLSKVTRCCYLPTLRDVHNGGLGFYETDFHHRLTLVTFKG